MNIIKGLIHIFDYRFLMLRSLEENNTEWYPFCLCNIALEIIDRSIGLMGRVFGNNEPVHWANE